jgi:hypothetical protein
MPAFNFERISPPVRRGPVAPIARKRGIVARILDRLVEARVRRSLGEEKRVATRGRQKPAD